MTQPRRAVSGMAWILARSGGAVLEKTARADPGELDAVVGEVRLVAVARVECGGGEAVAGRDGERAAQAQNAREALGAIAHLGGHAAAQLALGHGEVAERPAGLEPLDDGAHERVGTRGA